MPCRVINNGTMLGGPKQAHGLPISLARLLRPHVVPLGGIVVMLRYHGYAAAPCGAIEGHDGSHV